MSQYPDMLSQAGNEMRHDAKRDRTREFPRLLAITSPEFWRDLTRRTPCKQMKCCKTLSMLCNVALQRQTIRRLALHSDLQHVRLSEGPHNSIASCLNGSAFAASAQAISITAHIICFAFDLSDFHHVLVTAKHLALKLGLCTTDRRVLF